MPSRTIAELSLRIWKEPLHLKFERRLLHKSRKEPLLIYLKKALSPAYNEATTRQLTAPFSLRRKECSAVMPCIFILLFFHSCVVKGHLRVHILLLGKLYSREGICVSAAKGSTLCGKRGLGLGGKLRLERVLKLSCL